ncbi:MAG: hypothetical protein ACI957_002075 [Verrucomicrobiales bacterium]|jgi:hypothetical protein
MATVGLRRAMGQVIPERQTMDGLNDEVDEIVFGDPITHVRGQQHWCFTVDVDEAGTHAQKLAATLDL